jgi:integrase
MAKLLLTDISIRALKPDVRMDYWDAKTPAFGIRVGKHSKTFIVKKGNRRLTIGRYGDWTLQRARDEARRLLLQRQAGRHVTVDTALSAFVEMHMLAKNRPSTRKEHERVLRRHLAPVLKRKMEDVTKTDIIDIVRQLHRTPSAANHFFTVARVFFRWAHRHDYLVENPMAVLAMPHRLQSRSRTLSDDELKRIWHAADGTFGTIVRLLILTGQRRGEIAALETSWLDLEKKTLNIPANIAKNGRGHALPLGSLALSFLEPYLTATSLCFPARGTTTPFNGWSKSKAALDKASGVTDWTLHDLRRTHATIHARIGTPLPVIERMLNHVSGTFSGVVGIYQRHDFLPEMRAAVETYEQNIRRLVA